MGVKPHRQNGDQWQCPAMMVGPVICAALLAFGHHLYYDSLNDTRAHSINYLLAFFLWSYVHTLFQLQ
jgi:hypothetical protein